MFVQLVHVERSRSEPALWLQDFLERVRFLLYTGLSDVGVFVDVFRRISFLW